MARPPRRPVDLAAIAAQLPDPDDVAHQRPLRELAREDPMRECAMRLRRRRDGALEIHREGEIEIAPGRWRDEGCVDELGLPPACPVTPLGKEGDVCWFLDTMGAVYGMDAKSSGKGPIEYLFGGRAAYLEWAFPRWSKPSRERGPMVIGWDADLARQVLVAACAYRGYFSIEDQVRGRGAWKHDDGSLIYHAGDIVWIDGHWRPPGIYGSLDRPYIYPAKQRIGRPAARTVGAGSDGPGEQLLACLETFNWDRPALDPKLMLGWTITAKMGGALERRPVAMVCGAEGSGKSTLQAVLRAAMNRALIETSNTTQAGIYQRLQQDSIAILIDELEAKDDTRTVDKILELARIAYSGDRMQRGGKDGVGREFQLRSSFMGSSISKPATDAQDDSRMVVCVLRERERAGGKPTLDAPELEAIGRHLLRRIFDWWPTWWALLEKFRATLIAAGHNDRACDTFAPLAAGCHLALHNAGAMPTDDELEEWRALLLAGDLEETASRQKTWLRCLKQLLNAQPDVWRSNAQKSVGALLEEYQIDAGFVARLENNLSQVGLAISWGADDAYRKYDTARLFVPASHPGTHALFAGTHWAGRLAAPGPWINVLRQAPKRAPDGEPLWWNGKCGRGLDKKASGLFVRVAAALELQ